MLITGIGDLHLDGKLSSSIPDFNDVIANEVRSVLNKARRKGHKLVIFYGDLCERYVMSDDARRVLLEIITEYTDLMMIFYRGNHDTIGPDATEPCSLDWLAHMQELKIFRNVQVVRHAPQVFFENTDTPVKIIPWPYTDTEKGMLNALHVEAQGAHMETGRPIDHGINTKHLCVVGHIHTAQQVRNTHFSGTLYQTTFGEAAEKFYHEITWTGDVKTSKVRLVPHAPKYTLHTHVITSQEEYDVLRRNLKLDPDPCKLYRALINSKKVILPANAFDDLPTVIKHSPYKSKQELASQLTEDLSIDDNSTSVVVDADSALKIWLDRQGVEPPQQDRVNRTLKRLLSPTKERP